MNTKSRNGVIRVPQRRCAFSLRLQSRVFRPMPLSRTHALRKADSDNRRVQSAEISDYCRSEPGPSHSSAITICQAAGSTNCCLGTQKVRGSRQTRNATLSTMRRTDRPNYQENKTPKSNEANWASPKIDVCITEKGGVCVCVMRLGYWGKLTSVCPIRRDLTRSRRKEKPYNPHFTFTKTPSGVRACDQSEEGGSRDIENYKILFVFLEKKSKIHFGGFLVGQNE